MGKPWSAEETATLRRMHAAGDTFTEIGSALQRTANCCIGKANRLGLVHRDRAAQGRRGYINKIKSIIASGEFAAS